jgi:hypothetical protein
MRPHSRKCALTLVVTVVFVVVDIAKSNQVLRCVLAFVYMMLDVVQFKHFSRVVPRKHRPAPAASNTLMPVPLKHFNSNGVGNNEEAKTDRCGTTGGFLIDTF